MAVVVQKPLALQKEKALIAQIVEMDEEIEKLEARLKKALKKKEEAVKELDIQKNKEKERQLSEQKSKNAVKTVITVFFALYLLGYFYKTSKIAFTPIIIGLALIFLVFVLVDETENPAADNTKKIYENVKDKICETKRVIEEILEQKRKVENEKFSLQKDLDLLRKGNEGELECFDCLRKLPDDYFLLNDIYLTVGGTTIQIDTIVIGPNGLFVIEAKNHSGDYIIGHADIPLWMQYFKDSENSFNFKEFKNPVKQNWMHTIFLKDYFKESCDTDVWINPIVVFCDKNVNIEAVFSPKMPVIKLAKLNEHILQQKGMMPKSQVATIIGTLKALIQSKNWTNQTSIA